MTTAAEKFSVIIPARNAEKSIHLCLQSVFSSRLLPSEVIVVDDGSTDQTRKVAADFPCNILLCDISEGPMQPRLAGARAARYPILVFVDADVCVYRDTLEKALGHFESAEVSAVTGMLSREFMGETFYGRFKNEYMVYIFSRQPRDAHFLYGSFWAVRARDMVSFDPISDPFGSIVADTEAGLCLKREGKRLLLDHQLQVRHLKEYSFKTLMQNDFVIPFMFSRLFFRYHLEIPWRARKSFSHVEMGQVFSLVLIVAAVILSVFSVWEKSGWLLLLAVLGAAGFYVQWIPFLKQVKDLPDRFALKAAVLLPLDACVMFAGMTAGLVYSVWKQFLGILRKRPKPESAGE